MQCLFTCSISLHAASLYMQHLFTCSISLLAASLYMQHLFTCSISLHAASLYMQCLFTCSISLHAVSLYCRRILTKIGMWRHILISPESWNVTNCVQSLSSSQCRETDTARLRESFLQLLWPTLQNTRPEQSKGKGNGTVHPRTGHQGPEGGVEV